MASHLMTNILCDFAYPGRAYQPNFTNFASGMIRVYVIVFLIQILLFFTAAGQDVSAMPKLHPSSVTVYDIDRGLPVSCLEKMVIDPRGRLFISPCRNLDIFESLSFYQYDGDKSRIVKMEAPGEEAGPFAGYLKGCTEKGFLFGTNDKSTRAFLYNPDNGATRIVSFDNAEEVRNMIAGSGDEAYILTVSPGFYALYSLTPETKKLLVRVPASGEPQAGFSGDIPALRSGEELCFLLGDRGFVHYSLTGNSIKQYTWQELTGNTFREDPNPALLQDLSSLNMTVVPGGKWLFYLRAYGGFFLFDPLTEQFARHAQLNAYVRQMNIPGRFLVNFFQDNQQNTLVHFARNFESALPKNSEVVAGVLWDRNGQMFDFKPVTQMAAAGRYNIAVGDCFFSRDFKKQVLIATGGGMIAVEVKANLPVRAGLEGWASRAMGQFDKNRVLVTSESGNKAILDLLTMKATRLACRENNDPWCQVRNYMQIVSKDGQLWIPCSEKRLACYQEQDQTFRYYDVGQDFEKFNFIQSREIALANTENELWRYHLDQGKLSPFLNEGAPLKIGGTANELVVDKNGILWVASLNGLWRVDPRTGAARRLGKADGLADERIMCIHEAENGELWLGTLGGGLLFYNPATGATRVLNQSMGLSNNSVVGILADDQGDRWLSTFEGLTVVSPNGNVLFELSEEDGLAHREFNRYSYLKTRDGRLLFGGVNGVTLLEPLKVKSLSAQKDPLQIYLTDIGFYDPSVNNETHRTSRPGELERIVLPAAHRYIKIDFGLSDLINPEKCAFSYRLRHDRDDTPEGEKDAIWTNIGSSSELSLNDLPVGSYTILIRGINAKGQWTETPLAIPVTVQEFFYKTWWFYVLCALPFLLGAYFWIRRLHTERERLEAEVAIRTEQIRHDKELIEQQAAELQEMDELKSRFFTNISHEFRTPLTVISGMVTQIRQQPEQWLEKGMELIQRNSNQLLTLINQILDLRKLESGALKVHLVQGNIIPYLRYIAESFVQLAQAKGLRIHVLANAETLEMDYDPDKMMHILSNLLSNAIKYTPAPGDIYLQIDRRSVNDLEQLTIQVRDTGQGIAPEALPYIFDQFYQVEDMATQKPQGSGVGLALTRELVKLLGGSIEVASTQGAGTTFSLTFPITRNAPVQESQPVPVVSARVPLPSVQEKATAAASAAKEPVIYPEDAATGLPTLLIVEDNPDVRLYLTACLENHYQLYLATNGQEGINQAIEQVPDLIVSDVMMPVKDGFALCDTLKNDERTSHIPIVLLTAKADFESRLSGLRRGADAYLTKPFEQEELLVRLEQLLTLRKKLQERYRNSSFTGQEPGPEAVDAEDAFILKIRRLVLDHLAEEHYGIVHLCRALGVGRTQLHNKLKALTGQSTSEFIRAVRLNKARELLQTTDMNVSEVSYEVGISNPAYFSRIYAEAFGEAPRETR